MHPAARRAALTRFRASFASSTDTSSNCRTCTCLQLSLEAVHAMSRPSGSWLGASVRAPSTLRIGPTGALSSRYHSHVHPLGLGRSAFTTWPGSDRAHTHHQRHSHHHHQHSHHHHYSSSSHSSSSCGGSGPSAGPQEPRRTICSAHSHANQPQQQPEEGSSTTGHSATPPPPQNQSPCTHDHDHDHDHDHHQCSSSAAPTGRPCSPHSHHHHHHHHHHHFHTHSHSDRPPSPALKLLSHSGLFRLAEHLEQHNAYTITAVASFATSLALQQAAAAGWVAASLAGPVATAALVVPFLLLGVPQLAETLLAVDARQVDTHVLMSLSVVGTLYMGMAQEGALLLLLFRVSHLLEDKLTAAASSSLARLFDSVPSAATLVEVEEDGAPRTATAHQVAAAAVALGSHVLVRPGEQVPLDGRVVWGVSNVSMQHISGESLPVKVEVGADVPAGSLTLDGLLVLQVSASSEDSTPARMARMASEAQAQRPQLTRWLDQVGSIWSKSVIGATLATMVLLPLLGVPFWGDRGALYRAMGVLTAGSPCALALVPLAYACAIAVITMRGMLIKSGAALDALHACKVVALDKTGTLTTGALTLSDSYDIVFEPSTSTSQTAAALADSIRLTTMPSSSTWLHALSSNATATTSTSSSSRASSSSWGAPWRGQGVSQQQIHQHADAVKYAVALSRLSNHPVSRAMVEAGRQADADVSVLSFEQVPGSGVQGRCQIGDEPAVMVRFGSLDWVANFLPGSHMADALHIRTGDQQDRPSRAVSFVSVMPDELQASSDGTSSSGSTQLLHGVAAPPQLSMLCFEDVIQSGVPAAVQQLQSGSWSSHWFRPAAKSAKDVVMLTGDNPRVAAAVAAAVGIEQYKAALRPEDKLDYVRAATAAAGGAEAGAAAADAGSRGGLVMAGDGINDAPALAAATVGVAIAASPTDMVASAADIIVLNGQGVTNLPWLFHVADRTDTILKQNLALALISVVVATVPTLAGIFPLWLAVTLHEGSTLLVALNSLRLLLESGTGSGAAAAAAAAAGDAAPGSSTGAAVGAGKEDGKEDGRGRGGSGGLAAGNGGTGPVGGGAGAAAQAAAAQGAVGVNAAVAAAAV